MSESPKPRLEEHEGGCRAPSLHLWYCDDFAGDILTQDVMVPAEGLTTYTYYCCLNWNSGKNGGGYCGIQDHPDGRNYIYSIWDPIGTSEPIQPVFKGPGTKCERFGGEGTGLKSWNFELDWEPGVWYRMVTRCWHQNDHTFFGCWVQARDTMKWTHLVTVDFPVAGVTFNSKTVSFLEDWMGSGENVRRVHFRNGFKRNKFGKWCAFDKADFNIVEEESSRKYASNVNSGCCETGAFFMQAGGSTCKADGICKGSRFCNEVSPSPADGEIRCSLEYFQEKIVWKISDESTPQFKYTVSVDGTVVASAVDSETRECAVTNLPSDWVELEIEDIYGRIEKFHLKIKASGV